MHCAPRTLRGLVVAEDAHDLRTWIRSPEDVARIELEAIERDARSAFFFRNHAFQIAVREYQRQARVHEPDL